MRRRPIVRFRPDLERFEAKQLLSASPLTTQAASPKHSSGAPADTSNPDRRRGTAGIGYFGYRVTQKQYLLTPALIEHQVLVQKAAPVPGKTYNILSIAVKNNTYQTFTAKDNFSVRIPGFTGTHRVEDHAFPILTGNEVWKPEQVIVFYIMGNNYYPLSPQVAAGFQLNLGGRSTTLIPGPSAIALRIKYDPATFARTLDWIVCYGQGAQTGHGPALGIPDTSINNIVRAGTNRIDYGGHF
jgi:hypothetical protein